MRSLCLLLLFGFVVGLAACGSRESQKGELPKTNNIPPAQLASWKIELQAVEPIVPDQPQEFTATVKDPSGQPVTDAQVELSLTMKTMDMGENKVRLSPLSPGIYSGKATFTMAGPWQVEVRVTKNGLTAIERFPYTIKEPPEKGKK